MTYTLDQEEMDKFLNIEKELQLLKEELYITRDTLADYVEDNDVILNRKFHIDDEVYYLVNGTIKKSIIESINTYTGYTNGNSNAYTITDLYSLRIGRHKYKKEELFRTKDEIVKFWVDSQMEVN